MNQEQEFESLNKRLGRFGGSDIGAFLPLERKKVYKVKPIKQSYDYEEVMIDGKLCYQVDMRKYHEFTNTQKNLIKSKVAERIYGKRLREASHPTIAMKHGIINEGKALDYYNKKYRLNDKPFIKQMCRQFGDLWCASPDGAISHVGKVMEGLEIKCPYSEVRHLDFGREEDIDDSWLAQVHWYMLMFELYRWTIVSFDPNAPDNKKMFTRDIYRNEEIIEDIRFIQNKIEAEMGGMLG